MAGNMVLREKNRKDYKSMNEGEKIEVKKIPIKRTVLPSSYEVERIVAKKDCPKEVNIYPL